jgi:hypothetical protein
MNMTKLSYGTSCIFVNPTVTVQINPSLTITAIMQVIIATDNRNLQSYDDIEVMDIDKIEYSGFTIEEQDKIKSFTKYHKELGIDIWQAIQERAEVEVKRFTPAEFIEEYTPFKIAR